MGLPFATGHTVQNIPKTGEPLRPEARHVCHCELPILDEYSSCQLCGRYPQATIDATWRERAAYLASKRRKRT